MITIKFFLYPLLKQNKSVLETTFHIIQRKKKLIIWSINKTQRIITSKKIITLFLIQRFTLPSFYCIRNNKSKQSNNRS
jgi:hypothetical protein